MSPPFQPGDAVCITRTSFIGKVGRFVEACLDPPGFAWVAIDDSAKVKGKKPPGMAWYNDQKRAPRKLVHFSHLESIPEPS
jgi:hypothetical protein